MIYQRFKWWLFPTEITQQRHYNIAQQQQKQEVSPTSHHQSNNCQRNTKAGLRECKIHWLEISNMTPLRIIITGPESETDASDCKRRQREITGQRSTLQAEERYYDFIGGKRLYLTQTWCSQGPIQSKLCSFEIANRHKECYAEKDRDRYRPGFLRIHLENLE